MKAVAFSICRVIGSYSLAGFKIALGIVFIYNARMCTVYPNDVTQKS